MCGVCTYTNMLCKIWLEKLIKKTQGLLLLLYKSNNLKNQPSLSTEAEQTKVAQHLSNRGTIFPPAGGGIILALRYSEETLHLLGDLSVPATWLDTSRDLSMGLDYNLQKSFLSIEFILGRTRCFPPQTLFLFSKSETQMQIVIHIPKGSYKGFASNHGRRF